MKIKNAIRAVSAAVALAAAALPASAGYVVLDGWQMKTPITTVTNIGRLNLVSGSSIVEQEVNGLGQAFVGAKFKENGLIYSVTYTPENTVGPNDAGAPSGLGDFLTLKFSNLVGHVTAPSGANGFKYVFDSGNFEIAGAGGVKYATGSIVGIGGTLSSTAIVGGTNGDSTALALVGNMLNGFDLKDSTGTSLVADLVSGKVLFEAVTNNLVGQQPLVYGACSFDATKRCQTVNVGSAGDAFLVRSVPEPGSLALAGLSLLGLAAIGRRKSTKR